MLDARPLRVRPGERVLYSLLSVLLGVDEQEGQCHERWVQPLIDGFDGLGDQNFGHEIIGTHTPIDT